MGTSHHHVPRILARHCSQSHHCHFFAVGVVVGVVVVVTANANTAGQGRWGCRLAIVAALLRLVITVVVLVSAIPITWDDDDKLPVVLLLGWEFQFLVPIFGTTIVSRIPIPFSIPKILVGYFLEILMSGESENWNSNLQYLEFR